MLLLLRRRKSARLNSKLLIVVVLIWLVPWVLKLCPACLPLVPTALPPSSSLLILECPLAVLVPLVLSLLKCTCVLAGKVPKVALVLLVALWDLVPCPWVPTLVASLLLWALVLVEAVAAAWVLVADVVARCATTRMFATSVLWTSRLLSSPCSKFLSNRLPLLTI